MKNSINYNLKLPENQDIVKVSDLSENFVKIDIAMKSNADNITKVTTDTEEALAETNSELSSVKGMAQLNKQNLEEHEQTKVTAPNGVHGIRISNGKIQYLDENGNWELVAGGDSPKFADIQGISYKVDSQKVTIKWEDPQDVMYQGVVLTKWAGTRLIRKVGSYPVNENDGVVVVNNGVRNQYKTNGYVDTGLTNGTEYYYLLVPYSDDNQFTISEANRFKATPVDQMIYGFQIDENNLNPNTAVTYIQDAVGMTPGVVQNGVMNWGSWEPFIKSITKRVVVKNGVEQYQVQYDNPTKKMDGTNAVLTGADGDLFTKINHLHRKFTKTSNGFQVLLSDKPFLGSTPFTSIIEDGYNQFNNNIMSTLQDLFLLIFKGRDSQTLLGRGYVDGNSDFINTGGTNGKGYIYGETTGKLQMCFLGIEDLWGNKFQWVDGLVSDSSYNILTRTKSFNDSGIGYSKFTTGLSSSLSGYVKTVQGGDAGYVLADTAGSTSTGYCDYGSLLSGKVASFGGDRSYGGSSGVFDVRLYYSASHSDSHFGARLCFKNTEGVYVGNYLGYVESSKLRSKVGVIPTGDTTIGAFRTHVKNNN